MNNETIQHTTIRTREYKIKKIRTSGAMLGREMAGEMCICIPLTDIDIRIKKDDDWHEITIDGMYEQLIRTVNNSGMISFPSMYYGYDVLLIQI